MSQNTALDAGALAIGGGAASWNFMSVNNLLALTVGGLTVVLLLIRIAIAWRDLRARRRRAS